LAAEGREPHGTNEFAGRDFYSVNEQKKKGPFIAKDR